MALFKMFDGKRYGYAAQRRTKREAKGVAKDYRGAGNLARVTHFRGRWVIWTRGR